ncbi:MAG TPA: transglycosylase SLT domain-containing protein [Candidatus Binatia bacterium]|nr:transglycosylase SLT domain-containing protein [Candidatus Binatia bacterium]
MRPGIFFLATILAAFAPSGRALSAETATPEERIARLFPRPAALEPQIAFWRAVFTEYSKHQVVLHDAFRLDKVYKVVDFRPHVENGMDDGELAALERIETDLELERLRATLLRLHAVGPHPESLTSEERRIFDLLADDPAPDRYLAAADEKRLRSQRGLKERFAEGIRVSRRYLPEMERIFREEGLPVELTRLPLIESCFNLRAYSKVGAAGIWQFMPKTGRLFMRVDNLVDERRDPIASTRAAAAFLSRVHDQLDTWPLAITAYNHGPDGIARAVDDVGTTDIGRIVGEYRGRAFGFASRNFYAEFLAALEIERDYQKHFGDLPVEAPLRVHERRLDRALGIEAAARLAKTDRTELATLNPALSTLIVSGRRPIPAGYRLRMPDAGGTGFDTRLAEFRAEERVTRAPEPRVVRASATERTRPATRSTARTHRVRRGQTLSHIARAHGVSVESLRKTNRLGRDGKLRVGQVIRIARSAESET